jgi:hypothetical protein
VPSSYIKCLSLLFHQIVKLVAPTPFHFRRYLLVPAEGRGISLSATESMKYTVAFALVLYRNAEQNNLKLVIIC